MRYLVTVKPDDYQDITTALHGLWDRPAPVVSLFDGFERIHGLLSLGQRLQTRSIWRMFDQSSPNRFQCAACSDAFPCSFHVS